MKGAIEIFQIPVLQDNYVYVVHAGIVTAVVDPAVHGPVEQFLEKRGWKLDFIWNTHHHRDHVGANLTLKKKYGCSIWGAEKDAERIPGIDHRLRNGAVFTFAGEPVEVIAVDGHTVGHIAYYIAAAKALFCGDTIFSLGCGKLFEGSAEQMWASLARLRSLPSETLVYNAHEYTEENARFALLAEAGNPVLVARAEEVRTLRRSGLPTVPTTLAEECATNPFLRPESKEIKERLKIRETEDWKIFREIRAQKDRFDSGELL